MCKSLLMPLVGIEPADMPEWRARAALQPNAAAVTEAIIRPDSRARLLRCKEFGKNLSFRAGIEEAPVRRLQILPSDRAQIERLGSRGSAERCARGGKYLRYECIVKVPVGICSAISISISKTLERAPRVPQGYVFTCGKTAQAIGILIGFLRSGFSMRLHVKGRLGG